MLKKVPELIIDSANPFSNDELDREEGADNLTELISTLSEPFVISINSPYGTGKTKFVEMWAAKLRNEGYNCHFFNAWDTDFSDDPLISFIGEFQTFLKGLKPKNNGKYEKYVNNMKKFGSIFIKNATPLAIQVAIGGTIGYNDIEKFLSNFVDENVKKYMEQKDRVKSFQENLEKFVKSLAQDENSKIPFVFFIDELDRCRPTYAIELLENIKHLFHVNGLVFILALDMEQLAHSVKSQYGMGMDSEGYLRRFFDLEYTLPKPSNEKFCHYLFEKFNLEEVFPNRHQQIYWNYLRDVFIYLSNILSLSLRTQEQCFTRINIILRIIQPNKPLFSEYLAFLTILKATEPQLYNDLNEGKSDFQGVKDKFFIKTKVNIFDTEVMTVLISAITKTASGTPKENADLIKSLNSQYNEGKYLGEDGKRLRNFLEQTRGLKSHQLNLHKYMVNKLEISERFNIE